MAWIAVNTSRTFLHARAGSFGIMVFLRVAWGLILAYNTFSLSTNLDQTHQLISLSLFCANGFILLFTLLLAIFELWAPKISKVTSRVGFELTWIIVFALAELAGAVIFTILFPKFRCLSSAPEKAQTLERVTDLLRKRMTLPEITQSVQTCRLSNMMVLVGAWVIFALSLLYFLYFVMLAQTASFQDSSVWRSRIYLYDWSITSDNHPSKVSRPSNPQMAQFGSSDTITSSRVTFINPFTPTHPEIPETPKFYFVEAHKQTGVDRHQIMAAYNDTTSVSGGSYSVWNSQSTFPSTGSYHPSFDSQAQGGWDARQLAAMRLEGVPPSGLGEDLERPKLNVLVPKNIPRPPTPPDVPVSPRTQRNMAHESIGRLVMDDADIPFGSTTSLSSLSTYESIPVLHRSPTSMGNSPSVPTPQNNIPPPLLIPPLHFSFYSPPSVEAPPVQAVKAPHSYPVVQHSPERQSAHISVHRKSTRRKPVPSYAPSGSILPMHAGDVVGYPSMTNGTHQNPYSAASTSAPRRSTGHRYSLSASAPHPLNAPPRQSLHQTSRSVSNIPFSVPPPPSISPSPQTPSRQVPLSLRPGYANSSRSTENVAQAWHLPRRQLTAPASMAAPRPSNLPPPPQPRRSSLHHRAASASAMSARSAPRSTYSRNGLEDMPFGVPGGRESDLSSSYDRMVAAWKDADTAYKVTQSFENYSRRGSEGRGKLRKADPRARALV